MSPGKTAQSAEAELKASSQPEAAGSVQSFSNESPSPLVRQEKPLGYVIICMALAAVAFSVFAIYSGDWSIFVAAGYCVFMVLYPLFKGTSSSNSENSRKEFLMLGLICASVCLLLTFLVRDQESYAEVVTIIMALVGVKLILYPNYHYEE